MLSWLLPRNEARSPVVDSPAWSSVSGISFFVRFRVDITLVLHLFLTSLPRSLFGTPCSGY